MFADKHINWDETTDVLIIGYGFAGAVAAITAHDLGEGLAHELGRAGHVLPQSR